MKKHSLFLLSLLILLLINACHSGSDSIPVQVQELNTEVPELEPRQLEAKGTAEEQAALTGKYIIREGHISLEVDNYQQSRSSLFRLVAQKGGYISREQERTSSYNISNELVIRVPNTQFEGTMQEIAGLASHVHNRQVSARDVSEEYIDIETRLKTKKAAEERYISFLQKAKTVEEIIQLEEAIRKIREEIESREGRLKYLQNQISLSTIQVFMEQRTEFETYQKPGFWSKIGGGLVSGWEGVLAVIIAFSHIWPLLLIVGGGMWALIRYMRRKKKRPTSE
ncbi:MAG: DUF4349 domain-containing protein [Bacteroidota bacterium]